MAVDMFLTLDGVDGEARDKSYEGKIDILAWSWGVSNSGDMHVGGGGGAGKANFQDISCTKYTDFSSATLLQFASKGKHIDSGKLVVRKAGDDPLEYITIELKKILISNISMGGSGGEDRLTENVTLNFEEFKYIYKKQSDTGGDEGTKDFGWNIAKGDTV